MPRRIRRLWVPRHAAGAELVSLYVDQSGELSATAIARALGMSRRHVTRLMQDLPPPPTYRAGWVPIAAAILCRTDLTIAAKVLASSAVLYGIGAAARYRAGMSAQRAKRARRALRRAAFNTQAQGGKVSQSDPPQVSQSDPTRTESPVLGSMYMYHPSDARARVGNKDRDGWEVALTTEWRSSVVGGPNPTGLLALFTVLRLFERSEAARVDFARRMAASSWSVERVLGLVQVLVDPPRAIGRVRSKAGTLRRWLEQGTAPRDTPEVPVGKQLRRTLAAAQRIADAELTVRTSALGRLASLVLLLAQVHSTSADVSDAIAAMQLPAAESRAAAMFVGDHGARHPLAALVAWACQAERSPELLKALPPPLRATVTAAMLPA